MNGAPIFWLKRGSPAWPGFFFLLFLFYRIEGNWYATLGRNIFGVEVPWFVWVVGFEIEIGWLPGLDKDFMGWGEEGNILVVPPLRQAQGRHFGLHFCLRQSGGRSAAAAAKAKEGAEKAPRRAKAYLSG
jgi:hypothetical protein